ncbi:hypothetical protein AAZX31_04G143300 [Glycine max]|nr:hypothetical protein GLYMA_04G156850v4 [Glycine max]KAH1111535.1 hypothetical protein GYH30_010079 [Glycine max]
MVSLFLGFIRIFRSVLITGPLDEHPVGVEKVASAFWMWL